MENTNPPFGPTLTPAPQPKSSGKGKIIIAVIAVLAVATGAAAYYFWPTIKAKFFSEQPPSISFSSPKFQGMLSPEQIAGNPACQLPGIAYTAEDVAGFADRESTLTTMGMTKSPVKAGIHLYTANLINGELTMKVIKKLIVPVEDNVVTIAYYSYGKGDKTGLEKGFYLYPEISGNLAAVDDFVIPAHQGFVIISCLDTEIYSATDENKDGRALPLAFAEGGIEDSWILTSYHDGFFTDLNSAPYEIKSVWQQTNADLDSVDFGDEPLEGETLADNGYKMLWVKTGAAQPVVTEISPTPAEGPVSRPTTDTEVVRGAITYLTLVSYDAATKTAQLQWNHVNASYRIYILNTDYTSGTKLPSCGSVTSAPRTCIHERTAATDTMIATAVIKMLEPGTYNFLVVPVYNGVEDGANGITAVLTLATPSDTTGTATDPTPSTPKSVLEGELSRFRVDSNEDTLDLAKKLLNQINQQEPKPALTSFYADNEGNAVVLSWLKPKDDEASIADINNYEIYYKPESEASPILLSSTTPNTVPYLDTDTNVGVKHIYVKVHGLDNGIYQFSVSYLYQDGSKTSVATDTLEVETTEEGGSTNPFEGVTRIEPGSTRPPRSSGDTGGITR